MEVEEIARNVDRGELAVAVGKIAHVGREAPEENAALGRPVPFGDDLGAVLEGLEPPRKTGERLTLGRGHRIASIQHRQQRCRNSTFHLASTRKGLSPTGSE